MSLSNLSIIGLIVAAVLFVLDGDSLQNTSPRRKFVYLIVFSGFVLDVLSLATCEDAPLAVFIQSVKADMGYGPPACEGSVTLLGILTIGGITIFGLVGLLLTIYGVWTAYHRGGMQEVENWLVGGFITLVTLAWRGFSFLSIWFFTGLHAIFVLLPCVIFKKIWPENANKRSIWAWSRLVASALFLVAVVAALWGAYPPKSPAAPVRFPCPEDSGEQGVWFGETCWPLTTKNIGARGIRYIARSRISNALPLADLTKLEQLYLSDARLSDVTPLSNLTALQKLFLSRTQVIDLKPLSQLTALEELSLNGTQVSELGPLAGLTKIRVLSLNGTQVRDLTPLSGLIELRELYLWNASAHNLTHLSGLTKMHMLQIHSGRRYGGRQDTPENRAAVAQAIREWRRR